MLNFGTHETRYLRAIRFTLCSESISIAAIESCGDELYLTEAEISLMFPRFLCKFIQKCQGESTDWIEDVNHWHWGLEYYNHANHEQP